MKKEELRNRFLKEIPHQIISGEQLSYADWLEQLITSGELVKLLDKPVVCDCCDKEITNDWQICMKCADEL
jgi:hypothetical protein